MTSLLRVPLLALLVLSLAPEAFAQNREAVTVTRTPSGLVLAAPSDIPVGDAPVALLTQADGGAWSLRPLSPGDVPSEIAARPHGVTVRALSASQEADLDQILAEAERIRASYSARLVRYQDVLAGISDRMSVTAPEAFVRYSVTGYVERDASRALVLLSGSGALASAESTVEADGRTRVEAEFRFGSVEAWTEWEARPETTALLAPLAEVRTRLQMR